MLLFLIAIPAAAEKRIALVIGNSAYERIGRLPNAASDATLDRMESAPSPAATADVAVDLAEARARLADGRMPPAPGIEGPIRDGDGRPGYRVFLPVRLPDGRAGILVGRYDAGDFLEEVLRGRARGYATSVSWRDEEVYARGAASVDEWQTWWDVRLDIPLSMAGVWALRLQPTAELAAARLTPVHHYLLGAGIQVHFYLPTMLHCKTVMVDDELVIFGTANFNQRSIGKDDEIIAFGTGNGFVSTLRTWYDEDWNQSRPFSKSPRFSRWSRMFHRMLKPFRQEF